LKAVGIGRGGERGDDEINPGHKATPVALPRDERHCSKDIAKDKTARNRLGFVADTKRGFPIAARRETARGVEFAR
jgi:hypothetical protein